MSSKNACQGSGSVDRRTFLKGGAAGVLLGNPALWAQQPTPARIQTNIDNVIRIPKPSNAIPGPYPGRVVEVRNLQAVDGVKVDPKMVQTMFEAGIQNLTGKDMSGGFRKLFSKKDVIGIKVNPVGAGLISTHLEVVDAVIGWLESNGVARDRIIIWDRFDFMLTEAGFTAERYPGIGIEGLQTMDVEALQTSDNSKWLNGNGKHISESKFDPDVYYWADVEGPKDMAYLNQHVVNGKYSYFGLLLTKKLTKIINIPVFKNTGNGISMATKNIGYGAICNTNRLHQPLFFDVCTEVCAFPVIRDKMILNITDGLVGQYEGGPGPNANYVYPHNTLYFATDPFALDMVCHQQLVEKRKEMGVKVNEHPRFTEYLRYAEKLGLGIADPSKIEHVRI